MSDVVREYVQAADAYVKGLEAELERLRARDAVLREVIFSLDYAIGQWEQHGPPGPRSGFDVLGYMRDMRRMTDQ